MKTSFPLLSFAPVGTSEFCREEAISEKAAKVFPGRAYSPYSNQTYPSQVYFGDTHVHTGLSGDAGGAGTRLGSRGAR